MLGQEFRGSGSVVDAEPRRRVHLRVDCTSAHGGTSDWIYQFAPAGGATRCSLDIDCADSGTGAGAVVMLERIFGRQALIRALERVARQLLENLAALAETQVPHPT